MQKPLQYGVKMKMILKVFLLGVWIVTLLTSVSQAKPMPENHKAWIIPQRTIPLPAAVSQELQEVLARLSQPNVERAKSFVPKDKAEWQELVDEQKGMMTEYIRVYAKEMSVKVEKGRIGNAKIFRVTPLKIAPEHKKHIFIYIHGGAYVFGSGEAGLPEAIMIAHTIGIPVLAVDYRTAPKDPFPAAVDDMVTVYKKLLEQYPAKAIAVGGTSSGGGLALASVHKFKSLNLPLPGAIYAGTPWSDLTKTGDSYYINEGIDHKLITYDGFIEAAAKLYANGTDMKDPLLSPIYGDFSGFPPTYLVTGTRDLFLSNTIRVHRKLRRSGVEANLNVYEGFSHVEYLVAKNSPEAQEMYKELGEFLAKHLSNSDSPKR